ncbi:Ankyrin repeat domain-containing protein 30A [Amphibalanus amphitrite]|uniref:Ankyrin repeat domain-containing protein 30A n=1 Tax=Amphibalanus amphitrite TaxID=1232801 RepID=A0A6A4X0H1_AMPAM|nr:Ankyrin repeat domain-containing protein 30A [Amphibalanus amphitrite]
MKKVLSRLAKVGRSSSHAAAEPAERDPQADTAGGTPGEQTERPAAYDLVGRERTLSGLQRAVWDGDVARVRSLTAKSTAGVQARDREGRSLLHLAAARGHREMVELLLERRLPVDAEDGDGNTPLLKAAEADSAASVRLLLERGASASHCNHHQQNGLHVSSRRGAEPVLQALLQHGANVDQVDKDGHTPLHLSVLHAHPELAAALLLHGAALAPADRDGRTALHLAAGRGLSELVAQLLEGGAEAELRDDEGLTAGELAVREGFPHIQSQIRRLSRRHRSLSQMFSVEDLGVDGPPPAETAKVQRLGSTSSAGVPTPRVASSLSSAGAPTPRLASSLSSAREAAPRLASSLSSAGEPEPGPGRCDSAAAGPAVPISAGSDSWSDDDELNFAPPPRKPSIPLPACFLAGTSPLPTDRAGDHGGAEPASAPVAEREPPSPPQPAARAETQPSPVAPEEDSWGDAEPARRARVSSWCDDPVSPAGPAAPTPASAAPTAEDSGSWDDSSSAADDGGNSARLVASPPAERGPVPSELRDQLKVSADPESAHQPQSSAPTAAPVPEPDDDTWDSSVAESAASPRPEPGVPEDGAGSGPQRPVRRRSVTLLSPPRSRETSASETADATHTQCSTSLAGTLGRDGTLQGTDELWAGNATLRADGTIGGGSPRDGGPTDQSPLPDEPPPLELASPDRPPRLGQRRVSVSLPLSADRALPVTGEQRRRGSVTSVSSTSSVSSLKSVGRTLREWRQTLLAPLRSRRRRRSLELPVRRHSIAIDSFLTEQAELTADDQVEDMYREQEAPRRAVSHSPELAPARPPRGRLRSRSVEAPPPAAAPRRHRLSGGSLADIVEADAEEEAEERRRRRGRWRSAGGGGRPGRRLSLDVTALGLPRSRHRSLVSPTADQRGSDG